MSILEAIVLGVVEGVTEFLPISSTGHLTIVEKLMGFEIDDPDITAFTAIIQIGAIAAVIIYFRDDLGRSSPRSSAASSTRAGARTHDFRFGFAVAVGSIPIAVAGLVFRDMIEGSSAASGWSGSALIVWSVVMYAADRPRPSAAARRTSTSATRSSWA